MEEGERKGTGGGGKDGGKSWRRPGGGMGWRGGGVAGGRGGGAGKRAVGSKEWWGKGWRQGKGMLGERVRMKSGEGKDGGEEAAGDG